MWDFLGLDRLDLEDLDFEDFEEGFEREGFVGLVLVVGIGLELLVVVEIFLVFGLVVLGVVVGAMG